jgi:myo-inositol-1(or 4)-monophosphatase
MAGSAIDADWLGACRRIVAAQTELFENERGIAERTVYDGVGEGGDKTLVIDRRAEDAVFAELEAMHRSGLSFTAISEERGTVRFGDDAETLVVVDPIDGSLNARRMLPAHALSIAVASGPTMADVEAGFVFDFGAREEFWARRGEGATVNEERLRAEGPGYGLEVVGLEAAKPERIVPMLRELEGRAYRIRALGSIALSVCNVAGGRYDGFLTARACRSVDAAAAQLVAREAGAALEFGALSPEQASLDLDARYHVTAAGDAEMLALLRPAQALAEQIQA